jgi:hypothetical protein
LRKGPLLCQHHGVRSTRLLAALCLAFAVACASARTSTTLKETPLASDVQAPGLLFQLRYQPADAAEVQRLRTELLTVAPKLSRWGEFRQGVFIQVHPDHAALEEAVHRRGYPWLHAWAYRDQIQLESPRGLDEISLQELLAHELTHSLMFQLMAQSDTWNGDPPPVWFREGMASVTAGQGYRRMSASELQRWTEAHPGADLLNPTPDLYRTERDAVYAAAHRAFEVLLGLVGDRGIREILRGVSNGEEFAQAFARTTGHRLADFESEAVRSRFNASLAKFNGSGGP